MPFPFFGVGADGKARMAGWAPTCQNDRRNCDARIDGDDAGFVSKKWIEIDFADLGKVGGELCKLHQHRGDSAILRGRHVPVSLKRRDTRVRAIRSWASFMSSGGRPTALSSMTSTACRRCQIRRSDRRSDRRRCRRSVRAPWAARSWDEL